MSSPQRVVRIALLLALLGPPVAAQIVNPADAQKGAQQAADDDAAAQETPLEPATVVTGSRDGLMREEDLVGPYRQPRWTTRRLFPTTRVYVVPPGQMEFEHWTRVKVPEQGSSTVETQYEFEIGLPNRFQLDLYAVTEQTGSDGDKEWSEQKYELRYALADWGELWMNPTTYFEYVSRGGAADKLEAKLLLGDEVAPGWHFGTNLVYEHEIGDALESEYGLTVGIARTIVDEKLSLGAEIKAALVDEHGSRGHYEKELEIGPTLRWQPVPHMHVDFAPLVGIGDDSRAADVYLVLGWEL